MIMKQLSLCALFSLALCATTAFAEKIELTCDDSKALIVKASSNGVTRISVKGDKLRDVMGLEENVVVEKNETDGQLFLRNVQSQQIITLITENGLLQDLTLVPGAKGSMNIVLTPDLGIKPETHERKNISFLEPSDTRGIDSAHTQNTQEMLIGFIKQLFVGLGQTPEKEVIRTSSGGLEAVSTRMLSVNGLIGEVFTITNTHDNTTIILEKDFYQSGDVAIALAKKQLCAGESTSLFVIRTI